MFDPLRSVLAAADPFWIVPADQWSDFLAVCVAALLAGVVGLEREFAGKAAGFRTHMIIGGASALIVRLAQSLVTSFEGEGMRTDPIRVIEAIVVGVSFIGGGSILRSSKEDRVRNLTTAASTLFSAGIGICVAISRYHLAVGVTLAILVINFLLARVDRRLEKHVQNRDSELEET